MFFVAGTCKDLHNLQLPGGWWAAREAVECTATFAHKSGQSTVDQAPLSGRVVRLVVNCLLMVEP